MDEWYGYVTDVEGDTFTAMLRREGRPDIVADFSMQECGLADLQPYDEIIMTPESVRRPDPVVWTREQLDAIKVRAEERSRLLNRIMDEALPPLTEALERLRDS